MSQSSLIARSTARGALRVLAPVALLLGFLDLARGGTTAGPLLLVLGYFVLVPAMMLLS